MNGPGRQVLAFSMPSIEQLRKLVLADPSDPFSHYALAQELAKAREFGAAIESYEKCIAVDPLYCYAYYHGAVAHLSAGNEDGARAMLERGLAAAKKAEDAHALSELQALRETL